MPRLWPVNDRQILTEVNTRRNHRRAGFKLNPKRAKINASEGIWAGPCSMLNTIMESEKVSEVVAQQSLTAPQDDLFSEYLY